MSKCLSCGNQYKFESKGNSTFDGCCDDPIKDFTTTESRGGHCGFPLQNHKNRQEPDKVLEQCAELYRKKNADYADSWRTLGRLLHLMFPKGITLKTEKDFTEFFLIMRSMDKYNRIASLKTSGSANFESISDTWRDASCYGAMGASLNTEDC